MTTLQPDVAFPASNLLGAIVVATVVVAATAWRARRGEAGRSAGPTA